MKADILEKTSSHWVRYSEYEWRTAPGGELYITPKENAQPIICDPLDSNEELVLAAMTLGRMCMSRDHSEEQRRDGIMDFVSRFGLLGLMTALPTTPDFMEYEYVYLPRNPFIKAESMETDDYLRLFFPFEPLDVIKKGVNSLWNVTQDRTMIALAMTFGDRPEAVNMSFQRQYAERYDWLKDQFASWAFTFMTSFLYYEDYDKTDDTTLDLYRQSMAAFNGNAPTYHIALLEEPTIVWDFNSLLLCAQLLFSLMLTDKDRPLRMCRNCTNPFIAKRKNSYYCSPECRTQYSDHLKSGKSE